MPSILVFLTSLNEIYTLSLSVNRLQVLKIYSEKYLICKETKRVVCTKYVQLLAETYMTATAGASYPVPSG